MTITYETNVPKKTGPKGPFWGLTFLETDWGNINHSTPVADEAELILKFGNYNSVNENDWMQAWNFLQYSPSLKIFRVAKKEQVLTWTADPTPALATVTGSATAHLFVFDKALVAATLTSYWLNTNGTSLFYHYNDISQKQNIPTMLTNQLLFIHGRYCGNRGNDLAVSIVNDESDLSTVTVFNSSDTVKNLTVWESVIHRKINVWEIGIAIIENDEIKYVDIISLDPTKENSYDKWDNPLIDIEVRADYENPAGSGVSHDDNVPKSFSNVPLMFGASDAPTTPEIVTQISAWKYKLNSIHDVIFQETTDSTVLAKIAESIEGRLLIYNEV